VDTILFTLPFFFHRNIVQRLRETGKERKLEPDVLFSPKKKRQFSE
jgi:hypothetical protein